MAKKPPTMPTNMQPDAIAFCNWVLAQAHAAICKLENAERELRDAKRQINDYEKRENLQLAKIKQLESAK